jgi:hypothetical protein
MTKTAAHDCCTSTSPSCSETWTPRKTTSLTSRKAAESLLRKFARASRQSPRNRAKAQADLAAERPRLDSGAAIIRAALDLLDEPQELYRQTSNAVRRQLNQVFFGKLYLDADEVNDDLLAEPFDGLLYGRTDRRPTRIHRRLKPLNTQNGPAMGAASQTETVVALLERIERDEGSNKDTIVEVMRLYLNRSLACST